MADLTIRNGLLVDGTGAPARPADVVVDGDRIVGVTEPGQGSAGHREIDADGRLVTPGFVDIHTHYDGQATWDPEMTPSGWHGVTTVVMGNCGVGFAPADPARRDWLIQLMEGVEDIPGTALAEGMSWNWESFPEYLDELDSMPRVMDVAAQIPHGAVRGYVMGERGAANEPASAEDIALMSKLVEEGLRAGAVGFTTTRTVLHRAKDGELAAGTTAEVEELLGLGDALGAAGTGVFGVASDMIDPTPEFDWMIEISRRTGRPVTFGCLQNDVRPEQWRELLDRAADANAAGARIVPQVAGRPACLLFGFESSVHPFITHRAYREIAHLPLAERVAELRTPERREAILSEEVTRSGFGAYLLSSFQKLFPLGDPPDYEPAPERSVAAIAAREGRRPEEVTYDLMLGRDGTELLYFPMLGYSHGDFEAMREMLDRDDTVLGLGDGGAHCGILCDASLPTYMLTHWSRDRDRGARFTLEQVVAMQTSRTAALYGFDDRGVVAPGLRADLNVIDLDGLRLSPPEMVHDLPAGGRRLIQRATGFAATICAGEPVRLDDESTGSRPGRLVRSARA
ncbi:MAG TPA: amidohydrolase family protein [Microthrixaceae bacterium]|nr:amidohydrolase family protein [Microthrixaceae bacterium]HNA36265.1 amidohydrolase family protein [Microthrixaceae bacterium]HNE37570.1 amidohydrolase family protein [Microthrixaceae bacterium]HNH94780.1 amidohydrolase family protein [Microthrixaceae bacterium]HNJ24080.1 amidohydrolase family protein [Microthrixaceae bacterium]